ncbi:copper-exporting ATPase / responsive-to-antagonist 1 / copper-transporting ATPase (RAN1) [Artemisia annua]|uniref:Copper-exporting ATPase / responsive-to-antagonist 1 / copper-transporting ATPase (RAN1) n=1 Tax=Artemisia annua TaxID=35608 RepID=A0A2U1P7N5_ARTAN|nr:copper-exporting ATPase / responsive-to-antagonist 1 / copper-transporting ATPase (RAN1) [Artemisia annua]
MAASSSIRHITVKVTGMTCSACSCSVEGALMSLNGVVLATVDLLQHKANVTFDTNLVKDLTPSDLTRPIDWLLDTPFEHKLHPSFLDMSYRNGADNKIVRALYRVNKAESMKLAYGLTIQNSTQVGIRTQKEKQAAHKESFGIIQ